MKISKYNFKAFILYDMKLITSEQANKLSDALFYFSTLFFLLSLMTRNASAIIVFISLMAINIVNMTYTHRLVDLNDLIPGSGDSKIDRKEKEKSLIEANFAFKGVNFMCLSILFLIMTLFLLNFSNVRKIETLILISITIYMILICFIIVSTNLKIKKGVYLREKKYSSGTNTAIFGISAALLLRPLFLSLEQNIIIIIIIFMSFLLSLIFLSSIENLIRYYWATSC